MANDRRSRVVLSLALEAQTEYITTTSRKRDRMAIIVGMDNSPNGLRKFYVSRPHVGYLSDRWYRAIKRNTYRTSFRNRRITKTIHFADDDANAMRIFLYIAHAQPTKLPQRLSLDELVQLARVAQRYSLNHLVVGYLDNWIRPHRNRILDPEYRWLYMAWQFGLDQDYRYLALHLAQNCPVNTESRFVAPTTNRPITTLLPSNVLDVIERARLKAVIAIIQVAYSMLFTMCHDTKNTFCILDAPPAQRFLCTSRSALGLQRFLSFHRLYPPIDIGQEVPLLRKSIMEIAEVLCDTESMKRFMLDAGGEMEVHPALVGERRRLHRGTCNVEELLKERILKVVDEMTWAAEFWPQR